MIGETAYKLYNYFHSYVSITIPTIYTNALSFYETCLKLIPELNTLRDNQDIISANYDLISTNVKSIIEEQINYLDTNVKAFEKKLDDFDKLYENKYNEYIMSRNDFEEDYKQELHTVVSDFINKLNNITNNFIRELENTYGIYTNNINTTKDNSTTEFETKLREYRENIRKQFEPINSKVNKYYEDMLGLFNDIHTDIENFKTNYDTIIAGLPERIVNERDLTPLIYNWSIDNPRKYHYYDPPIVRLTYYGDTEPSNPQEGELWYNTEYDMLLVWIENRWGGDIMDPSKLYLFEHRVFYFTPYLNDTEEYKIDEVIEGEQRLLGAYYGRNMGEWGNYLDVLIGDTTGILINRDTNEIRIYKTNPELENPIIPWQTNLQQGNHTNLFPLWVDENGTPRYYFYDKEYKGAYQANGISGLISGNRVQITTPSGYTINSFIGGFTNLNNAMPCQATYNGFTSCGGYFITTPTDVKINNGDGGQYYNSERIAGTYTISTNPQGLMGIKVQADKSSDIYILYPDTTVAFADLQGKYNELFGETWYIENDYIFSTKGFAHKDFVTSSTKTLDYSDDMIADKCYVSKNYYYKYSTSDAIIRRVDLKTKEVKDFHNVYITDMFGDKGFYVSTKNGKTTVYLKDIEIKYPVLKEIKYVSIPTATN